MAINIISDITVTIYAKKQDSQNENLIKQRAEILKELGITSETSGTDDFWLFYERYDFPKDEYARIKSVTDKYSNYSIGQVNVSMDCLFDYEEKGSITLSSNVRVSDPCYDMDTWCAGSLENVLPGTYNCFYQRTGEGRVAAIKAVHEEYDPTEYEPMEIQNIDVGVDSGECGIYDEDYFAKNCKDEEWYQSTFVPGDAILLDNKAFISSSGYGDGSYICKVARRKSDGYIVSIGIIFISFDEDEEES